MRLVILSVLTLSIAQAIDFYITSPYDQIKWIIGHKETVTWNILPGGEEVRAINVDLMDGDDNLANVVAEIAKNLPPSATSATWEVPFSIKPGATYFIRVSGNDATLRVQRFSHRFTILAGKHCSSSTTSSINSTTTSAASLSTTSVTSTTKTEPTSTASTEDTSTTSLRKRQSSNETKFYEAGLKECIAICIMVLFALAY